MKICPLHYEYDVPGLASLIASVRLYNRSCNTNSIDVQSWTGLLIVGLVFVYHYLVTDPKLQRA